MICPHCRAEYADGNDSCARCGTLLAPAEWVGSGAADEGDPDELAELVSTTDATLVPVVVGLLESAGIASVVRGADSSGLDLAVGRVASLFRVRAPGVRIQVARRDLEAARELLTSEPEALAELDPEEHDLPGRHDPSGR